MHNHKKRQRRRSSAIFLHDIYRSEYSTPLCNLSAIYHFSQWYGRGIIRGSHERARKGARSCIRAHNHGRRFSFVPVSSVFRPITSPRFVSSTANSPLFPVNAPAKSSAGRTPDCGRRNRDDNADKGRLSWLKVRELPWIMQRRARSRMPWNLYVKGRSFFVSNNLHHTPLASCL